MRDDRKEATEKTRRLVMTALFAALTTVATAAVAIPLPASGYGNLGDAVVLLGGYLLGGAAGAAAGGIGAALADVLLGAALYAPATLVIKALMAALAAALYRGLRRGSGALLAAGIAAECLMAAGYWVYEGLFVVRSFAGAAVNLPGNLIQGAFAVPVSAALALALKRIPLVRREFPRL